MQSIVRVFICSILLTVSIKPMTAQDWVSMPQGMGPTTIVISEDAEYGYVGFHLSDVIFKVRLEDLTPVAVADLSEFFPFQSYSITLDDSEEKLFVHSDSRRQLIAIDTQTMDVIHTIEDVGSVGMIESLYAPSLLIWDNSNRVKFVNTETYEVTEFRDETVGFIQIQESTSNRDLWYVVTLRPEGWIIGTYEFESRQWVNMTVIPPETDNTGIMDLKILPNGQKAYAAVWGGYYSDFHGYGWLYCIDLAASEATVLPIDGGAFSLEVSPDGRRVYVGANWPKPPNVGNVIVVDTQSDAIIGSISMDYEYPSPLSFTEIRDLQIGTAGHPFLYAVSNDVNALAKIDTDSLTLAEVLVFNRESIQPQFFARRPNRSNGYVQLTQKKFAYVLDVDTANIEGMTQLPMIREDTYHFDIVLTDAGRMLVSQGEYILEIEERTMQVLETHQLSPDIPSLWSFVLSHDQSRLYAIGSNDRWPPDEFVAINTTNFQTEAHLTLEGGGFERRPFELPDGSKLYALGGVDWGPVVVHVIETHGYTIQKTITHSGGVGSIGISAGPNYPFALDSGSHTLFVGAGEVVLGINTDTDVVNRVIPLVDVASAIGLGPRGLVYVNAIGLVYQPDENYLYIAHLDRAFVSIFDLTAHQFLPLIIPTMGFFPNYMFANDDHSKIYVINGRSDSISVIDVASKTVEKVIDLHARPLAFFVASAGSNVFRRMLPR